MHSFDNDLLRKIVNYLVRKQGADRSSMVKDLKKPRTTLYDNLEYLQKKGIVERRYLHDGRRSRPFTIWVLSEGSKKHINLEILIR